MREDHLGKMLVDGEEIKAEVGAVNSLNNGEVNPSPKDSAEEVHHKDGVLRVTAVSAVVGDPASEGISGVNNLNIKATEDNRIAAVRNLGCRSQFKLS